MPARRCLRGAPSRRLLALAQPVEGDVATRRFHSPNPRGRGFDLRQISSLGLYLSCVSEGNTVSGFVSRYCWKCGKPRVACGTYTKRRLEWTTYLRAEPLLPPRVLMPEWTLGHVAAKRPGETDFRIVVRTGASFANAESERIVAPPQVSQLTAEQHGIFDHEAFDSAANKTTRQAIYNAIAEREVPAEDASSVHAVAIDSPAFAATVGKQFSLTADGRMTTRYLVDPLAAAIIFFDPLHNDIDILCPLQQFGYLDRGIIKIKVQTASPGVTTTNTGLAIGLRRGETRNIEVVCLPSGQALTQLWLLDKADVDTQNLALRGRNYLVSPSCALQLVHAVDCAQYCKYPAHRHT